MAGQETSPAPGTCHTPSPGPAPIDASPNSDQPHHDPQNPPSPDHPKMSSNHQDLNIPPPSRRLGLYANQLNQPVSHVDDLDSVDFHLRKLVGLTIQSSKNNPRFTAEVLDEITDLTSQYMHSMIESLHKFTEVQRHRVPGIADLEMCFQAQNISPAELYEEYQRTKTLDPNTTASAHTISKQLNQMLRDYNAEHYHLDKDDPSLVFHANEQYEIAALVPRQNRPRNYIPGYFPDLPPDFTYTLTGDYMQRLLELKEIKVKLADESRLNEASLYKLIDDDEARWSGSLEQALESLEQSEFDEEEVMSLAGGKDLLSDAETPSHEGEIQKHPQGEEPSHVPTTEAPGCLAAAEPAGSPPTAEASGSLAAANHPKNRFDFVAYARKRRLANERFAVEMLRRRKLREKNVFMKAETLYSSSAKLVPTKEDKQYFEHVLESRFRKVIKATRKAEAAKAASLQALLEKKRSAEKEQEQSNGVYEFGFNLDAKAGLLEDSEDEMRTEGFGHQPIIFEEDKAPDEAAIKFDFGDEASLTADSESNAELADLEAELEAHNADLAGNLAPPLPTSHSAMNSPLEAGPIPVASGAQIQERAVAGGAEGLLMNLDNGMWGLELDSDDLQDLE